MYMYMADTIRFKYGGQDRSYSQDLTNSTQGGGLIRSAKEIRDEIDTNKLKM